MGIEHSLPDQTFEIVFNATSFQMYYTITLSKIRWALFLMNEFVQSFAILDYEIIIEIR